MNRQQLKCRLVNVLPSVQLVEHATADGSARLALHGVNTCKSPLCPLCAPKWQRTRSDEITQAIDNWGPNKAFFVTVTMRHNRRMRLALMHRLLTHGWGNMWSGRGGQAAAAELGGKPESIRSHDRTWSDAHGWHPHLHCLLFTPREGLDERELAALIDRRWPKKLASALKSFRALANRILVGRGCGRADCAVCPLPPAERGECPHLRERATRMFGVKLVPRWKTNREGKRVPASLHDSMRQLLHDLKPFSEMSIKPSLKHGVFCERVRDMTRLPSYLAKMGLELAGSLEKAGKLGSDGVPHYGLWQVAQLACEAGPLKKAARVAWSQLFHATFGTQTITFSNREKLGLPADPYDDGGEPAEADQDPNAIRLGPETSQLIGEIPSVVYRELARAKEHGLLGELYRAYDRGELDSLSYVEMVPFAAAEAGDGRAGPDMTGENAHGPMDRARAHPPPPSDRQRFESIAQAMAERVTRDMPAASRERTGDRGVDAVSRGRAAMADAWAAATAPRAELEQCRAEIRKNLAAVIGPRKREGS